MTEQTLLIIFIGLVALSLVAIAVSIGIVAWRAAVLLKELDLIAAEVRSMGEKAAADIDAVRAKLTSGRFGLLSLLGLTRRTHRARRNAKKAGSRITHAEADEED
jgi:hypothetical protein